MNTHKADKSSTRAETRPDFPTHPNTTLLIDAGNTRIKFALTESSTSGFCYLGHCDTQASAEEVSGFIRHALKLSGLHQSALHVDGSAGDWVIIGVCVAGQAVKHRLEQALLTLTQQKLTQHSAKQAPIQWLYGLTTLVGLRNDYATPATLGADRWLAAYGVAKLLAQTNCQSAGVLATFGTATTVDVIRWHSDSGSHAFAGGIIFAGLNAALRSVSASTALLPDLQAALKSQHSAPDSAKFKTVHKHVPNSVPNTVPNTTNDALLMGAILAQTGAVHSVAAIVEKQYGVSQIYIAGGAAPVMRPYLEDALMFEYPVLAGLAAFASGE